VLDGKIFQGYTVNELRLFNVLFLPYIKQNKGCCTKNGISVLFSSPERNIASNPQKLISHFYFDGEAKGAC
jgi:hypothetical protein